MIRKVDVRPGRAEVVFSGVITAEQLLRAIHGIVGDPSFALLSRQLWVFEDVEDLQATAEDIRRLVEIGRSASGVTEDHRVAICSTSTFVFGLGRMYEAYSGDSPWLTKVFTDRAEAEAWLFFEAPGAAGSGTGS